MTVNGITGSKIPGTKSGSVPAPFQPGEDDPMLKEMKRAAEKDSLVINPQVVDLSVAVWLGYLKLEESNFVVGGEVGVHYRPIFNLEFEYTLAVEGIAGMGASEAEKPFAFMHNLGATVISTLSKEEGLNLGLKLALAAMNTLGNGGIDNYIGCSSGLEFGNYSPRGFVQYTYLNDLRGHQPVYQVLAGMRMFFGGTD